jgi:hypothetical protein
MTNHNANDLLRLAMVVYPDVTWTSDGGGEPETVFDLHEGTIFDPANNSEQFVEMLVWLTTRSAVAHEVYADGTHGLFYAPYGADAHDTIAHNGTPAGIRAAVVEAAVRVAK